MYGENVFLSVVVLTEFMGNVTYKLYTVTIFYYPTLTESICTFIHVSSGTLVTEVLF